MIIAAQESDAQKLTNIALKSKSFWGYSDENIERWTKELTVSELMIQEMIVFKFIVEKEIIAFYILNQPKEKSIELEFLFVLPNFIGKGIGNQLLNHAFSNAVSLNCKKMILLADPNAAPFYQSKGFVMIDRKESSIAGRFLPVMQKNL